MSSSFCSVSIISVLCGRVNARFAAVRAGDKYRGAFEPVGELLGAARENQYIALDKQNVHLVKKVKEHPVILVCVLRRSTAAKQLDLHAFVCDSPQHALDISDNMHLLYARSVTLRNGSVQMLPK